MLLSFQSHSMCYVYKSDYSKLVLISSTGRHFRNATIEREVLDFCFSVVSVSAAIPRRPWVFGNVPMPFQLHQLLQFAMLPLSQTLPNFYIAPFLSVCKPLSAVSYGYCWKCCAVNYQMWRTGKICQEVIQKLLWSTLASQMQKNKATKRASLIVLISLVLGCIWSISPIRNNCLQLAPLPSTSGLLEEEKVEASTPFYWSLYYSLLFEEDDGTHEEDRGVPDPEWLSWSVTSFVESLCLQLISSTTQRVCCPRNVRRTGCLGKGISQRSGCVKPSWQLSRCISD